ncbi:hypothetical protein COCCADRAFT_90064 [Bipolaris zeicola 26-R-13]|uniref:CFEM domain-containing protein n=1 Tax=Cochliobolus carbonum (strain 26-R-13) TaxID=930089 RepID=W6YDG7_COCC2|nr:uncharacterized protein COCCADRAFT_90064 [Bipolaris zeicola 26-R-13]EUC35688.1 hypothetical protein COCCADRAFT_90064 [Bipolaris zeicola 26-R-13]
MRIAIPIVCLAATSVVASPMSPPLSRRQDAGVGAGVASVGACPMNCWNEAAVVAGCDPNTDDDCLCGPFFGAVTSCTAGACSIGENLAALDFLNGPCE